MSFPTSPTEGQQYTDEFSTVWEWHFNRWYRVGVSADNPPNYGERISNEAANGIPAGGTAGQILVKNSAADYVATWQTPSASYTDFYLGSYAGEANYPASASQGQWIIDSGTDRIVVWDNDGQTVGFD